MDVHAMTTPAVVVHSGGRGTGPPVVAAITTGIATPDRSASRTAEQRARRAAHLIRAIRANDVIRCQWGSGGRGLTGHWQARMLI